MSFLLDTDICSAHVRRPSGLMHRFMQHAGQLQIGTVSLAELYVWAYQSTDPLGMIGRLNRDLLQDVAVVSFDSAAAQEFGRLRVDLRKRGVTIPPFDLQIASIALVNDLTLVTHNTRDFEAISELRLEDWLI